MVRQVLLALGLTASLALTLACSRQPLTVTTIQLGKSVSEDHRVAIHTTAFKPTDSVYASVITGNTGSSEIEAHWFYSSTKITEQKKSVSMQGEGATEFVFRNSNGFPPGTYHVEIFVDGQPAGERQFRVDQ